MKTPISYYGGKQNLLQVLLPLIPQHVTYVEPFIGGASLLFAKQPSDVEVINDADDRVTNFWEVCRDANLFEKLQERIYCTMHSEREYINAGMNLTSGDPLTKAHAFWIQTNMSFANKIKGGFAFSRNAHLTNLTNNKRLAFTKQIHDRLKRVCIFSRDALDVIGIYDSPDTFIYLDPPYAESDAGHYDGLKEVYYRLLELLPTLKSKWLMSSYDSDELKLLRKSNNYHHKNIIQSLSVSGKQTKAGRTKTECLTWNYQLEGNLFGEQ